MSLAQRLATPPAKHPRPSELDIWFNGLGDADRAAVSAAIVDPAWQHVELLPIFIAEGAPRVHESTLGSWRRKNGLVR